MAQAAAGWQRRLAEILGEHTDLVLAESTLSRVLAQLARGAAALANGPPELSFIRVLDPRSAIWMQDVWAVDQEEARKGAFSGAVFAALQGEVPQDLTTLRLRVAGLADTALILPLRGGDACYGYLCLGSNTARVIAPARLPLIQVLAHQALQTIHRELQRNRAALVGVAETASLIFEPLLRDLKRVAEDVAEPTLETFLDNLRQVAAKAADKLREEGVVKRVVVEVLGLTEGRNALVTLGVVGLHRAAEQEVLPGYFAAGTTEAWQAIVKDGEHYVPSIGRNGDRAPQDMESDSVSTSIAGSRTVHAIPLHDAQGGILGVMNIEALSERALEGVRSHLRASAADAEAVLRRADPSTRAAATSLRRVMGRIGSRMPYMLDPSGRELRTLYQATLRRAVQMIGQPDLKAAIAFCGEKVFTITRDTMYRYTRDIARIWSWPEDQGLTGRARESQQSIRVADVKALELEGIYIEQDPMTKSEMVVPLRYGDQVVGVFDFISHAPDAFTQTHQEMIEAFAAQVVQTLVRARDISLMWLAAQDLTLVQKTNLGIEGMPGVQTMQEADSGLDASELPRRRKQLLEGLLKRAMTYTRSTYGTILAAVRLQTAEDAAAEAETTELVEMSSYGLDNHQRITHLPLAKFPSKLAVKAVYEKHPQNCSDITREAPDGALFGPEVKSALAVPFPAGDRVMGVLCLESTHQRMYSPAQERRVSLLASQVANVISSANLSLYRLKMQRLLNLVDEVMTTSLAPGIAPIHPQIRTDILQAARDLTEQHDDGYASLWLVRNGRLFYEASIPELPGGKQPQPGIVKEAFRCQVPVVVLDVGESPYKALYRRSYAATQSELAVPLLDPEWRPGSKRGRVLGVINVESPRKPAFSGRDVQIIELLARMLVTSMRLTEMHNDRINFLGDVSHGLPPLCAVLGGDVASIGRHLTSLQQLGIETSYADESAMLATFERLDRGIDTVSTFVECSDTLVRHEKLGQRIDMEEVSLLTLAGDMANALGFYAQWKERQVKIDPASRDVTVRCAKHLVRVAVYALIENAIKYGAKDDVIQVRVCRRRGGGGRIEVIDHGKPIPLDRRKTLFSRRYNWPRPTAGSDGDRSAGDANGAGEMGDAEHPSSLGIGLDHVWRIVHDVHGGRADYRPDRRDKRGKVFYLDLPRGDGDGTA